MQKQDGVLGTVQKRKSQDRTIWTCVTWYESVPYQVTIHSPDITAIKNVLIHCRWLLIHGHRASNIDEVISQTSNQLVSAVTNIPSHKLSILFRAVLILGKKWNEEEQLLRS